MKTGIRRVIFETCCIVALSGIIAFGSNAFRDDGLSLRESWSKRTAAKTDTAGFPVIALPEAAKALHRGRILFIDAREPGFYRLGHIPGAINLPPSKLEELLPALKGRLLASREIIIYCSSSSCGTSAKLAEKLLFEGIEQVRILVGGIEAWKQMKLPIDSTNKDG